MDEKVLLWDLTDMNTGGRPDAPNQQGRIDAYQSHIPALFGHWAKWYERFRAE